MPLGFRRRINLLCDERTFAQIHDFLRKRQIRREMALFARTGRATHAWRAYREIREAGLPMRPWFLKCVNECAERIDKKDLKSPEDVSRHSA